MPLQTWLMRGPPKEVLPLRIGSPDIESTRKIYPGMPLFGLPGCYLGSKHLPSCTAPVVAALPQGRCRRDICLLSSPPLRTGFGSQNTRIYHDYILSLLSLF